MATRNMFGDLALDTSITAVKTSVDAVKTKLDTGITVTLDTASLSALENTTVELGATSLAALESITVTGPLTDTQLRASPIAITDNAGSLTVDGSVSIIGTVPVSGTFWQATQPVSASSLPLPTGAATQTTLAAIDAKLGSTLSVNVGLTDTQLRATPVPVSISGSIPVTIASSLEITNDSGNPIPVSGSVAVTNLPATQAVSVTTLPLPVGASTGALQTTGNSALASIDTKLSGTLTVDTGFTQPLTDVQLRATALNVAGTVELGTTSLTALENTSVSVSNFPATLATTTKQDTIIASIDAVKATIDDGITVSTGLVQPLTDTQLRASSLSISGTVELGATSLSALENNTVAVSNFPATQPVSLASAPLATGASTATLQTTGNDSLSSIDTKLGGTLTVNTGLTQPLTDAQLRATAVPISATALPLPSGAATNAKLDEVVTAISGISGGGGGGLTDTQLRSTPLDTNLPINAATETTLAAIQSVQNEIKNLTDTMVYIFSAILEKMPRVTGNDQAAVSIETGTVAVSSLPTLATVTTVATVTNQTQIGGQEALSVARAQMMGGTNHIYNNIVVS